MKYPYRAQIRRNLVQPVRVLFCKKKRGAPAPAARRTEESNSVRSESEVLSSWCRVWA
jgi:hypothetical protein